MNRITLIVICLFLISNNLFSQKKEKIDILAFAETYGNIRFFYPNDISTSEWRSFLINSINEIEVNQSFNSIELFDNLYRKISPNIQFSKDPFFF